MLLMIHFLASAMMTGIIWMVQLVHYPAFKYVEKERAIDFHRFHTDMISLLVAPLMVIELATAFLMFRGFGAFGWSIFVLTILIWLSTFTLQVPLHRNLGKNWDLTTIQRLISTNWLRTGLWTIKTVMVSYWLYYS